jgi:hypothetical protein
VLRQAHVLVPAAVVLQDEDEIEAGEDGGLEIDVFGCGLQVVVPETIQGIFRIIWGTFDNVQGTYCAI